MFLSYQYVILIIHAETYLFEGINFGNFSTIPSLELWRPVDDLADKQVFIVYESI